ncbi:MAG TPA: hypothetical protein DHW61_16805 [Lachnoclostridium phytofermentans]|uniref:NERD domain-containing protein n=1 Tax=Lachnoclostridium phytofermentans TaxID=66219 RepID=A0A3D2XA67_9FIRM|nr:hypothetical protein [Lachnoclostridium sp.]HCL04040.1 hypothetical protein [Lachnoclostridium phytofermentans]
MTDSTCNKCHKNHVLHSQGLCYSCNQSKEKITYETLLLNLRKIFYNTICTILIYLINILPTILLYTLFANRYLENTNLILTYGISISFLLPYLLIKCNLAYKLWKMRYQQIQVKGIHLISEAIFLIVKVTVYISFLNNPRWYENKLSNITKLLTNITLGKINILYLTFLISTTVALLLLRAFLHIVAIILNNIKVAHYRDFYEKKDILPIIQFINKLENGYLLSQEFLTMLDSEQDKVSQSLLAIANEPKITMDAEDIFHDLNVYGENKTLLHTLSEKLTSNDQTLFLTQEESLIYYAYMKDKLTRWKDQNSAMDGYLEQELLSETVEQFENIKLLYRQCKIESKTFFELSQRYETEFELPLNELIENRKLIKLRIDQLYHDCEALIQKKENKDRLVEVLSLFGNKITHLPQLRLNLYGKEVSFDHIILSKQGIFFIEQCCFELPEDTSLLIEKDGSLWVHNVIDFSKPAFLPYDDSFLSHHNEKLLLLEQYLEENLKSEDIPIISLLVINQTGLHIENFSQRLYLSVNEIIPTIRSYQKQLNDEFLISCYSLLLEAKESDYTEPIPNYKELLFRNLEDNYKQKISLYESTNLLQSQIRKFKNSLDSCFKIPS